MSIRTPPLPALRSFAELSRLGSVNAAAEELNLTQSAIAHQIRALESFVEVPLVERKGRNLALTEQGRIYGYQVRRALEDIALATDSIKKIGRFHPSSPLVRVSVLPSLAYGWLLPRLPDFYRRFPQIRLFFHGSMEYVDLKAGTVDCAIRFGHGNWQDAVIRPLMSDFLLLVAAPKLLEQEPIGSLEKVLRLPLMHSVESWSTWMATLPNEESHMYRPEVHMEFTDSTHLLEAARVGLGVALTRRVIADRLIQSGELTRAYNHESIHSSKYYLLLPSNRESTEATDIFTNWLTEQSLLFSSSHLKK